MPPDGLKTNLKSLLVIVVQGGLIIFVTAVILHLFAFRARAAEQFDIFWTHGGGSVTNHQRSRTFQEFTPTINRLVGIGLQFNSTVNNYATATIKICQGAFVASNTCELVYEQADITAAFDRAEGIHNWYHYHFTNQFQVVPGQKYYFLIWNGATAGDQLTRQADIYADHQAGGWEAAGDFLTAGAQDLGFETLYDDETGIGAFQNQYYPTDRDNLLLNEHYLYFWPPYNCRLTGEPCYLQFRYNEASADDILFLYNTTNNYGLEPTGNKIASTSILDQIDDLGLIEVPYTATTTDGVRATGRYCLKQIDVFGNQPDRLYCGLTVNFWDADTFGCLEVTTAYREEHDAGQLCADIATSSIWEAGSWPGAMTCAGREVSYWLFTATSSDFFDLCQARANSDKVFPISVINSLQYIWQQSAATSVPTSTPLLPLIWGGAGQALATRSADFLSISKFQEQTTIYNTYYDTTEKLLWLGTFLYLIWEILGWRHDQENREIEQIEYAGRRAGRQLRRSRILGRPAKY